MMNMAEKLDAIQDIIMSGDLCAEAMVAEIGEILNDDNAARVVPPEKH